MCDSEMALRVHHTASISHFILTALRGKHFHPHFTSEEREGQRGQVTYPRSHTESRIDLGLQP